MIHPVKAAARLMLGSLFVMGGLNQLKDQTYTGGLLDAARQRYGLPDLAAPADLVRLNGAAMITCGASLALGIAPRASALALAAGPAAAHQRRGSCVLDDGRPPQGLRRAQPLHVQRRHHRWSAGRRCGLTTARPGDVEGPPSSVLGGPFADA